MPNEYKLFVPIAGTQRRQTDPRKRIPTKAQKTVRTEEQKVEAEEVEMVTAAPPGSPVESPKPDEPRGKFCICTI